MKKKIKLNMKRVISGFMCFIMIFSLVMSLVGCGNKDVNETTPLETETQEAEIQEIEIADQNPNQTVEEFIHESVTNGIAENNDMNQILTNIVESGRLPFDCVVEEIPVDAEHIAGFSSQITGYNKCVMLTPVMNAQPFVVYLFETEDVPSLYAALKESVDMRWNVCVEATSIVAEEYDNHILFGMLP